MSDKENKPLFSSINEIKKKKLKIQKEEMSGEPYQQTESVAGKSTEDTTTNKVQEIDESKISISILIENDESHDNVITGVGFSSDGKRILSESEKNTVKLWDVSTCQELLTLNGRIHETPNASFSPDGKLVVGGESETLIKYCDTLGGQKYSFKVQPGDNRDIKVWDASTGKEIFILEGGFTHKAPSANFSPDGKRIVGGIVENSVKVWDATTGKKILTLEGETNDLYSAWFSSDGKRIVGHIDETTCKVWDSHTGKEICSFKEYLGWIHFISSSPDGKHIAVGSIGDVKIFVLDATFDKIIYNLEGHSDVILSISFSPNGKLIASGSGDNTIKVWDATSGLEIYTLKGHSNAVYDVKFSPDGKLIASGSWDNTIKVWDANSGKEIRTLKGHSDSVQTVSFSPDGKLIASGSWDNTIKVWEVPQ